MILLFPGLEVIAVSPLKDATKVSCACKAKFSAKTLHKKHALNRNLLIGLFS
jgi:hypothetical protein